MTRPTPPIELGGPPAGIRGRIPTSPATVDRAVLDAIAATGAEVDDGDEARTEASRDWWPLAMRWALQGKVPALAAAVVRPATVTQVAGVLAACRAAMVPVTVAGGRSGVCGASVPLFGGVVLDMGAMAGVRDVDAHSLVVDVQAGTFGPDLERALRSDHGITIGHWPQSMDLSTVGGWLACRGAGQYSTRYGKIEDIVAGLEVVLADGTVVHTGAFAPRAATGPDLTQLFVGSEGTLGVITAARLRARPVPAAERRSAWAFTRFADGIEACRRVLRRGATPAVLRLYDPVESERNFTQSDTNLLLVLDEGDPELVGATMRVVDDECAASGGAHADPGLVARWLEHRNDVSALAPLVRAGIVVDTIEVAASWRALPELFGDALRRLRGLEGMLAASAHQSHAYADGACLYFTFGGQPPATTGDADAWAEQFTVAAWDAVMAATIARGGAISHHHGIGIARARYMDGAPGVANDVLACVKEALDPVGILNPGKMGLASAFGEVPWP